MNETTELPRNIVAYFLPGNLPDDEGQYPPHTPWMRFGPDGSGPWVIRCGGATLETSHQTFDSLNEWAQHFSGEEAERLRGVIIDREVADYKRENGLR